MYFSLEKSRSTWLRSRIGLRFFWLGEEAWHEGIVLTDAQKAFVIKQSKESTPVA